MGVYHSRIRLLLRSLQSLRDLFRAAVRGKCYEARSKKRSRGWAAGGEAIPRFEAPVSCRMTPVADMVTITIAKASGQMSSLSSKRTPSLSRWHSDCLANFVFAVAKAEAHAA